MRFKKTRKILKKSLILFICIWLFITQIPTNTVFAEETNEESPVLEVENQEEQELQEMPEEMEPQESPKEQEKNQEQEPLEETNDNEGLLTNLGEGEGEGQTPVNIIDLYKGGVKVDAKTINFAEAVDAVNSNKADKIVLLKSFNAKENYVFDNSVEVDLNGKKIIFNTNKSITFNGEQSSIKNGTIVVSSFESNATTAVIAVGSDGELQVDDETLIKSRVAFKLNDNASVHIKDAEICARNLFESSYNSSKFYIEDEAKMNLVSDLNELTGYGYWRTSNSGTNGTITITGGLFTNNKYPIYESNTTTADLSEYYISEYSHILVSEDPYKYQVVHGGGIVFDVKGGVWTDGFKVPNYYDYDKGLTLPTDTAISRAGYTFNGWIDIESGLTITNIDQNQTGSLSLYASWTARNDIVYKVKHHYELINEPGVFPDDAVHLFVETFNNGVADETVQPNLIPKDGYATPNKKTKQVAGDGSTVIDYYYRVGLNELVVSSEDESKGTVSIKDYPSTTAAIATTVEVTIEANALPGYKFNRWVNNNNSSETSNEASHKIIMGSESLSYTAYFEIDTESEVWVVKVLSSQETKASSLCFSEGDYLYYQTIEDAVEYAVNGATVIMDGDLVVSESVPIEKEITLNLNGHTISQAEVVEADYYFMNKHMVMVTSSGKLTIVGPGEILNDDTDDEYWTVNGAALYNNGGTLILDDGARVTTTGRHYPAILNSSGLLIVNEATITSNSIALDFTGGDAEFNYGAVVKNTNLLNEWEHYNDDDGRNALIYLHGEYITANSRVNIKGGTFTAKTESIFGSGYTYNYTVTVNGGTLNTSKNGYVSSTQGFSLEFYGGTVNSENYIFGDWCGVIYDGYFNIKNGIVPKSYVTCVYGGKFHVYDNNPAKINGLMYNHVAIKNTDPSDEDQYEYIVLGKSCIYFDSMGGTNVNSIEGYRNRPVENMPDDPTMTGYTFDGWYTERELIHKFDPTVPLAKENYYLYAKWKFNPNDSIWGLRLKTTRPGLDSNRKYEEGGYIYYYYWYDNNDQYDYGWEFAQAFSEAADGETIELLKDITLGSRYYYTYLDRITATDLTLELNNHTLTFKNNNYYVFNFSQSPCRKFTIQNGTVRQEVKNGYSYAIFESMSGTEVLSKNVNYISNYHLLEYYGTSLLAGYNIEMEIQGGFVGDSFTLIDSFTDDNTITIDEGYDFRFAGETINYTVDSLGKDKAVLKDGLYVYDPDTYADYGYVSVELPEGEKVTRKEKTYVYDEQSGESSLEEVNVTYNYKIVHGYKVTFDFNNKDKENTTLKANVATTNGVGNLTSDQIPETSPKDGYHFAGWYTEKTDGTKIDDLTQETINDDVTYYAHWNTESFEVDFDLNGGNVDGKKELDSITVLYKDKYPTLPTPTKDGYYFAGWYTVSQDKVSAEEEYPPLIEKDSEVLTADDHTLYAHWTVKTITVTFDFNGGLYYYSPDDSLDCITMKIDYDSSYTLPEVYKEGYTFGGWFTQKVGGIEIDGTELYSEQTFTTLYAHWTGKTKNLKLVDYYKFYPSYDSGETDDKTVTVTCGDVYGNALTTPTIEQGCNTVKFIGWNTDANGYGKFITSTDTFTLDDFHTFSGESEQDTYSLYAIYDCPKVYNKTLYFDYGYNQNSTYPRYYSYCFDFENVNEEVYIPETLAEFSSNDPGAPEEELPTPQRLGYTFEGWKVGNTAITKDTLLSDVFTSGSTSKVAIAQWSAAVQNICLCDFYKYASGGSQEDKYIQVTSGDTYGDSLISPSIDSQHSDSVRFVGWCLASIGNSGKYVTSSDIFDPNDYYSSNNNFTLYAIYDDDTSYDYNHKTIYFDYGYKTYSIMPSCFIYNYDGATTPTYVYDSTSGNLPEPTKEGYTFTGWKIGNTTITNETLLSDIFTDDSKYKVAVAQWTPTANINLRLVNLYTFDLDYSSKPGQNPTDEKTIKVTCNSAYGNSLSDPVINSAYESTYFIGWNTKSDASGTYVTKESLFDLNDYDLTDPNIQSFGYALYAVYKYPEEFNKTIYFDYGYKQESNLQYIATYKFNYSPMEYSMPEKVSEYTENTGVQGELPVPERNGYTFKGWKIDNIIITKDSLLSAVFGSDKCKTAVAQWEVTSNGINAYFYANGGVFNPGEEVAETEKTVVQTIGSNYSFPANPTKTGYTFAGWVLASGSRQSEGYSIYAYSDVITSSTKVKEEDILFANNSASSDDYDSILLVAVWQPSTITYKVRHLYENPYYSESAPGRYYEDKHYFVNEEEYTVATDTYVLIKPKEFDGVSPSDSNFYEMTVHGEKFKGYVLINDTYYEHGPFEIYYRSDYYELTVDRNRDNNFEIEEEGQQAFSDDVIVVKKMYRDVFDDSETRSTYEDGEENSAANTLREVKGNDFNGGYTFVKWVDDDGNEIKLYDETATYTEQNKPSTMPAEPLTIHAVWESVPYYIEFSKGRYESEIKESKMANQKVIYGTSNDKLNKSTYTREGYDFIGWSFEDQSDPSDYNDYETIRVDFNDGSSIDDNDFTYDAGKTVTLYPVWRAKEYTITYHLNGASLTDPYIVIENDCFSSKAHYSFNWNPEPSEYMLSKKGYNFIGWYVDEDGDYPANGTKEEINKWYEEHESSFINQQHLFSTPYSWKKDIDVYLRWDPCTYLFDFGILFGKEEGTFDVNSGETYRETFDGDQQFLGVLQTFDTNVKLPDFEIFTEEGERAPRTGYDFAGWYIGYMDDDEKYIQEYITEDTVIDEEFYDKFYDQMHQEPYENYRTLNIDSEWKERNDVKYKINIYLQLQDGQRFDQPEYLYRDSFPEKPTATYEFTGRARSKIDIYNALDHKKYKYDGFRFETGQYFDENPAIEQTISKEYQYIQAYDLQIRKGIVCPDGSTEFNVYYYRNFYPVYIYESRKDAVKITDEYGNSYWEYPDHYAEFQYGATADWDRVADDMKSWRGLSDEFNCFAVIYPSSVQELPTKMPSTELVLVPTYAGDEFKITFDANGGSFLAGNTKELTQYYDTLFNVPSEIPTLEGFAFDGWYLKDGTKIERTEDYYVSFRGDRTAYAHWSSPLFEVSIEDYSNDITNGLSIYSNIGDVERRINREYEKTVTIRLLSDAAIHDNASFMASSITFDLNGHTLFCDSTDYSDFITFVESDVTITDTSSKKLGKIVSNGRSTICLDNSSFRINAGTIENQSTYEGSTVLYVNNEPGVNVDILGGSLIYNNNEDTTAYNPSCIINANSSTINIGNGTKKDSNIFLTLPEYDEGSIIRNLSNVTINGGIFSAPGGNLGNFNEDDEVSVLSGFFELKDPIEGSGEENPSITDKLIFTGGYFNIKNIDAMDHYIDKVNNKVIINSFGGYYGNNTYLYFYEISDRVKTIVHFVVTDPENNLEDDPKYDKVTLNDVYTGDKISKPEIQERLLEVDDTDEYYFEGWTSSRDGNYNVTIISNGFEHTLYSLWTKKKHTLKFTIADESKGIKDPDNVEGTALEPTEIDIKDPGKYPALPSKEAVEAIGRSNPKYVFGGWYTSTNKAVKEGDQYKSNGILDGDEIVLHAKWVEADIYIVKMNSISKNNLAVKSLANLVCEADVVYENTDDNVIRIENENIKNYKFSYWEINGKKVVYDSDNNKWKYLDGEVVVDEVAVEGDEAQRRAKDEHLVGLNFTDFIEGNSKVVNANAVYEYIGVKGPLLTVEGYKEDYSVEVTYEEKEPEEPENGDPVEPEKKTFEPEFEESTGLWVVKENIKPGSKVKVIYDNEEQDFSAWTNYSNVIVTSKPTLESVVSVDTTYKLVTKVDEGELSENSYYIEFRNYSGLLVKSAIIKDETQLTKLTNDHSFVPTLIGWKFNFWSIDYTKPVTFGDIKNAAGDAHRTVVLRPMYKINTDQKVTVYIYYSGGLSGGYTLEEQLGGSRYITAPKEKDGHTFSCWKDGGDNILGYTNTYAISVINANSTYAYYACYDEQIANKEAIIVINDVGTTTELEEYQEKNDDGEMETKYREINKIVFSVTRSIPDDCELLEQGIIYSTSSSLSELEGDELKDRLIFDQNDDTKAWELQSGIKKYVGASKDKVNVLTVKFDRSGKEDNPIYLMGYIIVKYKDKDDIDIIYTDYRKNTFRDFVPKEEGGDGE